MTHNVTKHNVPFANEDNVLLTTKDKKKIAVCAAGKQKTVCWIITSVVGFLCVFSSIFLVFSRDFLVALRTDGVYAEK